MSVDQSLLDKATRQILEGIKLPEEFGWEEKLEVVAVEELDIPDPENDLHREVQFYNQALFAVESAIRNFKKQGISYKRPLDFYAEMVKTDKHMTKIKGKLLQEQNKIKAVEQSKALALQKKYSKRVHSDRVQEKARMKKQTLEAINNLRKATKGKIENENVDAALDDKKTSKKVKSEFSKTKRPGKFTGPKGKSLPNARPKKSPPNKFKKQKKVVKRAGKSKRKSS